MIKKALFSVCLCLVATSVSAVDDLTGLTGMYDSPNYKYEVRGQSSATVRLSQSLFEGGATMARVAIEQARLSSSKYLLAEAASSLAFDAVTVHASVARQKRLLELAQWNMDAYGDILAMLRGRVENGLATSGDISLVESRLFRARAIHTEYNSELMAAKANFTAVTGMEVPQDLAQVAMPERVYKSLEGALKACLAANPRFLAENETVKEAEGQKKLAFAGFSPQLGIEAGPRWHVQNTPQDSREHGVDAFLTFRWNIFDGGATSSTTRQAAAQRRQAMHNVQSLADQLKADVTGTWAQYMAAAERMKFYEKSMETAEHARRVFYEQYMLGTKNLLDLLDADNEYFLAASQHTIARTDKVIGAYRLLALGGEILQAFQLTVPEAGKK